MRTINTINFFQWSIMTTLTLITFALSAQQPKNNASNKTILDMILFEGDFDDKFIELKWSPKSVSASIKKYIVEYSKDGSSYRQIGTLSPNSNNTYQFKSIIYQAGVNYFRIVQVDKADNELVSERVNVMCGFPDRYDLDLKTIDNQLKIKLQVRTSQRVSMELLDKNGEVQKSLYSGEMERNEMIFRTIDFGNLGRGLYYLSIRGQAFRMSKEIKLE